MPAVDGSRVRRVRLVGADEQLEFSVENGELSVTLPEQLPLAAVTALDLGSEVRARLGRVVGAGPQRRVRSTGESVAWSHWPWWTIGPSADAAET